MEILMPLPKTADGHKVYLVVGLLIAIVLALLWFVPRQQAAQRRKAGDISTMESFTIENESRKTLSQVATAFVLLVGVGFTWQQILGAEDGRITDRYSKAIEQLDASKSPEVHFGGIFALERVGLQSPSDAHTIREVLAAWVRLHACWEGPLGDHPCPAVGSDVGNTGGDIFSFAAALFMDDSQPAPEMAATETAPLGPPVEDVRAAMQVISRLSPVDRIHEPCLDLRYTSLPMIDLQDGSFESVCFDYANLHGANLSGAKLQHAQFTGATMDWANLNEADLSNAILSGARLHAASFDRAVLIDANLKRAHLGGDPEHSERDATGLVWDQLKVACLDGAELPTYITPTATPSAVCTL